MDQGVKRIGKKGGRDCVLLSIGMGRGRERTVMCSSLYTPLLMSSTVLITMTYD